MKTRLSLGWAVVVFSLGMAGCSSFPQESDVSRDQWEPPVAEASP